MDNSERDYLSGSIMLSRGEDGAQPEEYTIKEVVGGGGSAVCYKAKRRLRNGVVEIGMLKEFYPIESASGKNKWYYSLERLENGQLVPCAGTVRKFDEMCQEYIGAYISLKRLMSENAESEILKSYIQDGEILYGCMPQESTDTQSSEEAFVRKPTVYIWSNGPVGEKFSTYLEGVRKHPQRYAEKSLKDILTVVYRLVDCIKIMHTAGLMHLDIKPDNFLVECESGYKINPNSISLFDINSLCSVKNKYIKFSGTDGFASPELKVGKADNRSDIYSIGAMLFNAIVITNEVSDGLYRDFFYPSISYLVKHSMLISASATNSDSRLMSRLCRILEKCLAPNPRARYQSCTELKKDLKNAIDRLDAMLNQPAEKKDEVITDPTVVIQKLLYEHPIYETFDRKSDKINVLLIGSGTYGQKFIDVCLQAGQMSGIQLNMLAVSNEPDECREDYLRFRPALSEFVNINGSLCGREELAYATLDFKGVADYSDDTKGYQKFTPRMTQINREIVDEMHQRFCGEGTEYDYVFVSLGEDSLSKGIAECFSEKLSHSCPVCYVTHKNSKPRKSDISKKLYPVCISAPVDEEFIKQTLGEMGFNAHLSWMDTMNIDLYSERKKFFEGSSDKEKYNRASSISFALSIKYKLYSLNIDCTDIQQAADSFNQQILQARSTDKEAQAKFSCLVDLEHRRWIIEKAIDGWSAPRGEDGRLLLEDCVKRGSVKDNKNRKHPCLVRGSAKAPLNDKKYQENNHQLWNEGEIDAELDELDRMSIELHRCFRKKAESVIKTGVSQNMDILAIRNLIPTDCANVQKAFQHFQFVLKNILDGVEKYSRQYQNHQKEFAASLAELPEELRAEIEGRLSAVEDAFFPVIESNLYRDYKAIDETLIKKIPFILTHHFAKSIAIPFEDGKYQNGRNEAAFGNVASVTVLSPESIRYLYHYSDETNITLLIRKIRAVMNYLCKREVYSGVGLVITFMNDVPDSERNRFDKELKKLHTIYQKGESKAWLEDDIIYDVDSTEEAENIFTEYFKANPVDLFDGSNMLFGSAYDNAKFIEGLLSMKTPYFEFDWRNKSFIKRVGCEYLKYVSDASFISVRDMFALMSAEDGQVNALELADDYEKLWSIYTGSHINYKGFEVGVNNWNRLCACLEAYEKRQPPLARIAVLQDVSAKSKNLVYFLPEYTFPTVKRLVQRLIELDIADPQSEVCVYASDTCKVELIVSKEYEQELDKVFSDSRYLLPYYEIEVTRLKKQSDEYVEISLQKREVCNVNLNPNNSEYSKFTFDTLKELEKAHFVTNVQGDRENPCSVSFEYSSMRIKRLLTNAGSILEVYAYYEALKTGYFDDVACGFEFCWEKGGVKNELDLVLTKGFKSIIVECKAVVELKLDYYHKLHSIADHFGIGTIKVLLGNTYDHHKPELDEVNKMQRSRGSQLYITTISKKEDINKIGQTLIRLMEA